MEKYCISVDWLQTYCVGNLINEGEFECRGHRFTVQLTNRETAQFRCLYEVYNKGKVVAEIQQLPRTRVINPKCTLIKLSNRVLYSQIYIELLYAIQEGLNLTYKGITRIDLCYDCNKFHDGRVPERFINNFLSKELGTVGSMYRRGSDSFVAHGSKSKTKNARVTSIRFGSEKSRIGAYMYNKTLELIEVKDKPWIREMWQEAGLKNTLKEPVYRSEISIRAQGTDMLNMSTGNLFRLSPNYLEHAGAVSRLFHIYAHKYFDFRVCTGQKNTRHYQKLYLFEESPEITVKPYYVSSFADTGRMEKICYNKLQKLSVEYSDLSEQMREGLTTAMTFLSALSGEKLSIIRLRRYEEYLKDFYGKKWVNNTELAYLLAIEDCRRTRVEIDAEFLYKSMKGYFNESRPPISYDVVPFPDGCEYIV